MASLVPYVTFRQGRASVAFLTEVLGFEVLSLQPAEDGSVVHAELQRADALLMGGTGDSEPSATPGLYLVVADVDDVFGRAVDAGADVVFPPEVTEWGTRRARFRDLDGHEWTVGTYQPGQSWG